MRIADGELSNLRHVCGLFTGVDETYSALMPFIIDGLQKDQAALHIVGPDSLGSHLARLASASIDVDRLIDSGQLQVPTWDDSYLRGGRFDHMAMLLFLQKKLAEGRARGFAVTRAIGFMGWTLEQVPGVEDVIAYETSLDLQLRGGADPVICAYDMSRHAPGLIVRLQSAHPLAIVGGKLSPTGGSRRSPREQIVDAASLLFSRYGTTATGVDTLIASASVAKATFYRYFPSKNDLIVAWLSDDRTRWLDRVIRRADEIERALGSGAAVAAFFDAVGEWLEADAWRGSPYLNTAVELDDPGHPAHQVIEGQLAIERAYLTDLAKLAGHPRPAQAGTQLQTLLAGAITLSVAVRSSVPIADAREAAIRLVSRVEG